MYFGKPFVKLMAYIQNNGAYTKYNVRKILSAFWKAKSLEKSSPQEHTCRGSPSQGDTLEGPLTLAPSHHLPQNPSPP